MRKQIQVSAGNYKLLNEKDHAFRSHNHSIPSNFWYNTLSKRKRFLLSKKRLGSKGRECCCFLYLCPSKRSATRIACYSWQTLYIRHSLNWLHTGFIAETKVWWIKRLYSEIWVTWLFLTEIAIDKVHIWPSHAFLFPMPDSKTYGGPRNGTVRKSTQCSFVAVL